MRAESTGDYTVGLTGIIGSGKSTVAEVFRTLGTPVIDADRLARRVLEPGYEFYPEVISRIADVYGLDRLSLAPDGILDRTLLGSIAFKNDESVQNLNAIVHPHVRKLYMKERAAFDARSLVIYDVPLLFEAGLEAGLSGVIVVSAPEDVAAQRAADRLGIPVEDVRLRMARQIPLVQKERMADYIIQNDRDLAHLQAEVRRLNEMLRSRL